MFIENVYNLLKTLKKEVNLVYIWNLRKVLLLNLKYKKINSNQKTISFFSTIKDDEKTTLQLKTKFIRYKTKNYDK